MKNSEDFEPLVVTLSRKLTGDAGYGGEQDVHKFLEDADVAHIRLRGDEHNQNFEKLKSLDPDYVFLNYPWQRNYPPAFRPDKLVSFTRIAYVPYFLTPLVNEHSEQKERVQALVTPTGQSAARSAPQHGSSGPSTHHGDSHPSAGQVAEYLYQQRTHQLASLVFVQDEHTRMAFANTERGNAHVFVTGSPKLDVMRAKAAKTRDKAQSKRRKRQGDAKYDLRVLWAPHHSYSPAWLNFGRFKQDYPEMLHFAATHPRVKVTFRPHPFLLGTLVDRDVLTADELAAWQSAWNALPNTRTAPHKSFVKQFVKNDLLLTDGISFLAEYPLVTNEPAVFIENDDHWSFNAVGELAAACNIRIDSVAEFSEIVAQVLSKGKQAAFADFTSMSDIAARVQELGVVVDPFAGKVGETISSIVLSHFLAGAPLVDPASVTTVAWEDQPGREPRTD